MINLYTLPSCTICEMVKTKLQQKNISFVEKNFVDIAATINSDHAPALEINENGKSTIYNNPSSIVRWINDYGV